MIKWVEWMAGWLIVLTAGLVIVGAIMPLETELPTPPWCLLLPATLTPVFWYLGKEAIRRKERWEQLWSEKERRAKALRERHNYLDRYIPPAHELQQHDLHPSYFDSVPHSDPPERKQMRKARWEAEWWSWCGWVSFLALAYILVWLGSLIGFWIRILMR